MVVLCKRYCEDVGLPKRDYLNSAGYDLYASESKILKARGRELVKANLQLAIPKGFYGQIASRSGLAINRGVFVLPGVIDSGYRGHVCLIVFNLSDDDIEIIKGNRLAQMIFMKYYTVKFVEYNETEELSTSERGAKGFGSSLGF